LSRVVCHTTILRLCQTSRESDARSAGRKKARPVLTKAPAALDAWCEGELTFEQAMLEVVRSLFLAKKEFQHRLNYAFPPSSHDEQFVDL